MTVVLALIIDWLAGEPKWLYQRVPHPIIVIGNAIAALEKRLNKSGPLPKLAMGAIGVAIVVGAAVIVGMLVEGALSPFGWLGSIVLAVLTSAFIAYRSLADHVAPVAAGLEQDLAAGRKAVSHIVGRDVSALDASGVARAAIESLAENFSDGVIAPLFWFIVAGFPGLLAYKAINTMDSMWGYRNQRYEQFGKVVARLDDVANWIPARLTGVIIVVACRFAGGGVDASRAWRAMLRDARKHNSPNAGWPEAAMAGGLGIKVAGPRVYEGQRVDAPYIGDAAGRADLNAQDIRDALRLYRVSGLVTLSATILCAFVF